MKTFLECLDEAAAITKAHHISAFIKLNLDEIHLIMLQAAADIYASQSKSTIPVVMQAEGSDGANGAAVGNSAAGQSGSVEICDHHHTNRIWTNGRAYTQCLLCGKKW